MTGHTGFKNMANVKTPPVVGGCRGNWEPGKGYAIGFVLNIDLPQGSTSKFLLLKLMAKIFLLSIYNITYNIT